MKIDLTTWGPATVLIVVIAVIAVAVGGVVVILQPDTLNFQTYLEDLQRFAIAIAGLGLARAVHLGAQSVAVGKAVSDNTVGTSIVDSGAIAPDEGDAGRPTA